ncbi:MAG: hypothetical protein J7L43_02920 [Candidatus Aenigmarchaeota archaeon]|nr:hypothetical protein [Candidatus Aenigmarchaeota archaeon]
MIERVIISVSNKKGLNNLIKSIYEHNPNIEIIATSGTKRKISGKYNVIEVSEYTGMEEGPEGLVKTLHPKIEGGILYHEDIPEHREWMKKNDVKHIDGVIVNFYPFEEVANKKKDYESLIEAIDIGGPTMTRAAAKASLKYRDMERKKFVLIDPTQYDKFISMIDNLTKEFVTSLANETFHKTTGYDYQIWKHFKGESI